MGKRALFLTIGGRSILRGEGLTTGREVGKKGKKDSAYKGATIRIREKKTNREGLKEKDVFVEG